MIMKLHLKNWVWIAVVLHYYNYCIVVNLPKPPRIISRLIVLLGHPHKCGGRGEQVLHCLKALVPLLNEDFVDLWDAIIPKLLAYLDGMRV